MAAALRSGRPGGRRRLVDLLTRYGRAIEADLTETYGVDLAVLWAARRTRRLLVLIDGLPRNSRYVEAVFEDDEAAVEREKWRELRKALGVEEPVSSGRPRLSEFGPTEVMLAGIVDRLGETISAIIASAGSKPPTIRPFPRPTGADDRLAGRRRVEAHEARVRVWLV